MVGRGPAAHGRASLPLFDGEVADTHHDEDPRREGDHSFTDPEASDPVRLSEPIGDRGARGRVNT